MEKVFILMILRSKFLSQTKYILNEISSTQIYHEIVYCTLKLTHINTYYKIISLFIYVERY